MFTKTGATGVLRTTTCHVQYSSTVTFGYFHASQKGLVVFLNAWASSAVCDWEAKKGEGKKKKGIPR